MIFVKRTRKDHRDKFKNSWKDYVTNLNVIEEERGIGNGEC